MTAWSRFRRCYGVFFDEVKMHPFFQWGPLTLPAYGCFILLGALAAGLYLCLSAAKSGFPREDLIYASLYAAIGSAVSNVQDASQLSSIATVPMIVAIMGEMAVIASPDSTLSFWLSMIPFTSPTCMIARVTYGVAAWESILSLVILYATFLFAIWACSKIYRIGIFMYGKKPSVGEVIKWAKYK